MTTQEIAEQELQASKKQKEQVQEELVDLEKQAQHLQELYKKQDNLLGELVTLNVSRHS